MTNLAVIAPSGPCPATILVSLPASDRVLSAAAIMLLLGFRKPDGN